MKRCVALLIGLVVAQSAFAQTAMEKAEKRIAELVVPGSSMTPMHVQPLVWKPNRAVDNFDVPARSLAIVPARLPLAPLKAVKLANPGEAQPFASFRDESQGPKQVELATKPLIKLPSVDATTPLPLPILARPLADRAPLSEPAFEASLHAAMKRFAPSRDRATPFVPYNLPDPFEHVRYGQLRNPPEESAVPPSIRIERPTK